jgi:hypothetical protein
MIVAKISDHFSRCRAVNVRLRFEKRKRHIYNLEHTM